MNMRKIIAVLAAVLMLCAVVPFSVSAAPGDVILQGNFDDNNKIFSGNTTIEDGALHWDTSAASWAHLTKGITVAANTDYVVSFKMKSNMTHKVNVKFMLHDWSTQVAGEKVTPTADWSEYSIILNSGANTSILFMIQAGVEASVGQQIYIDDFSIAEYTDPAIIGAVLNGDFETGDKSNWSGSATVVAEGYNGGYAAKLSNPGQWASALTQTIPVEANTVYEITWMSKRLSGSGAFNLIVCQSVSPYTNYTKVAGQNWMNETSGNWVNNSFTINTGDNTSMLLKFTTEATNPGEILLDNIKVSKVKDPSFDGYITNGDFETGKTTPWDKYSGTAVTAEAAKDGDYGMMLSGGGAGYGGIANQNFTVVPGKTYTVRFDMKVVNAGVNVQIKDNGANVAGGYISKTEWTTYTYNFTPNYANANLNFCGSGIAGTDVAYLDNVMVYEKVEESNDGYIKNGTLDTGNSNNWSLIWGDQVAASVVLGGKDSTFAVEVSGKPGKTWGQFRQSVAVEPNTDYRVTVWAKNSNGMSLLVKDGADSNNLNNVSAPAGDEWTLITNEFNSGNNTSVLVGVMVNVDGASGTFDGFFMEKLTPPHVCEFTGSVTLAPTCTEDGVMTYECECGEGTYTEAIPAAHTYEDDCATVCSVCEEGWRVAPHTLTYVEGVVPANCKEEGYDEYWFCAECRCCYGDAEGTYEINPAWMYYTGEHTRPADAADCAVVTCTVCGEDSYGDAPCDRGNVPACQDANCVNCGGYMWGEGHSYGYDEETWESLSPLCQPGNCIHCGEYQEYIYECENGSFAPCTEPGECVYGCGREYPATGIHELENPCAGGLCWMCWNEIPAADHVYDNEFDKTCNVCGAENEDAVELYEAAGNSVSEDVMGLAFRFGLAIDGVAIAENRVTLADYSNATLNGYDVVKVGAIATNGVSDVDIEAKYITDREDDSIQFAVRIINIPDDQLDREIFVTPYVTVLIDGNEVTFFGEQVVNTYNAVLG